MHFAAALTVTAAIAGIPFVASATAPRMEDEAFLSAVRCAAYQSVANPADPGVTAAQFGLNIEARRQGAAVTAEARAQVAAIAEHAAHIETAADVVLFGEERIAACSGANPLIARARAPDGDV